MADERLCFKLPPNISREAAVTTPVAACIAYLGLFSRSHLNIDIKSPNISILVWGGSCEYYESVLLTELFSSKYLQRVSAVL